MASIINYPDLGIKLAHIADASVAHALADVFDDEESEAALNALGVKINAILLALENIGVLSTS